MKNILLAYGREEIKKDWMSFFDDYYFVHNKNKNIDHKDIKIFFQEKLIIAKEEDNLFIINNDLNININHWDNIIDYINRKIINKNKFCYLWNYMQECQKLKRVEKYKNYNFYATSIASDIYAVVANFKTWHNLFLPKEKSVPLYLLLQNNVKDNIVFIWPPLFDLPLDKINNNYLLTSLCKENFNAVPLQPYNNNVAKIFFILTISIVSIFFYFFWRKIPRPRYFYLKHRSQRF